MEYMERNTLKHKPLALGNQPKIHSEKKIVNPTLPLKNKTRYPRDNRKIEQMFSWLPPKKKLMNSMILFLNFMKVPVNHLDCSQTSAPYLANKKSLPFSETLSNEFKLL